MLWLMIFYKCSVSLIQIDVVTVSDIFGSSNSRIIGFMSRLSRIEYNQGFSSMFLLLDVSCQSV